MNNERRQKKKWGKNKKTMRGKREQIIRDRKREKARRGKEKVTQMTYEDGK